MKKKCRSGFHVVSALAAAALFVTGAYAQTTWHVDATNDCPGSGTPADPFCAIQPAINAASNGEEISVAPGTYNEAINFNGKAVHLFSTDGPDATTIDASGLNSSVVTCSSGEGTNTILEGFTITGGNASEGGGMQNFFSSPTIIDCAFKNNSASFGGAISNNTDSHPTIIGTRFENNTATNTGGGVRNVNFSTASVSESTFAQNSASSGGAIWNSAGTFCNSHVANSTFCENSPDDIFGTWHNQGGNEFLAECPPDCAPADLNCDGFVDGSDLLILLSEWGKCSDPDDCPADLDGNGAVDGSDLLILLSEWGEV
jgi:hypothetical protein